MGDWRREYQLLGSKMKLTQLKERFPGMRKERKESLSR